MSIGVFSAVACAACHIPFGITPEFEAARRADHAEFKCPNGHVNYFPQKSAAEKAEEARAQLARQLETERRWAHDARERERRIERSLRATRGVVTRLKNRAKA